MAHFSALDEKLCDFIRQQHMFFTASAPGSGGRVNLSPKGIDGLAIIDHHTVAYLDHTGSGNETAAHVRDNGRLTIMLCSFEGPPRILRLYGNGRSVQPGDADWPAMAALFPARLGARQIFVQHIDSVQTSCGFGVPLYDYVGERTQMLEWAEKKGADGVKQYQCDKNVTSIDGLPTGLKVG